MISDYVKGKKQFDYPADVQTGITLHRYIDTFTDEHPATKAARQFFQSAYRLYSGAFIDVVYDHFLANDPAAFTDASLAQFAEQTYASLDNFVTVFPDKFKALFPYMKQYNWLYHYREHSGIERSFEGVMRRSAYITESDTAYKLFEQHYFTLQQHYNDFFPAMREFAWNKLQVMLEQKH